MAVVRNRFKELLAEKERIEGRRIPYREIARKTGVHEGTLSRWANQVGDRFDSDVIAALCQYFGVDIPDLLVLMDENPELMPEALAAFVAA